MSEDRYDRFLRKKLESVRPGYPAGAWERFRTRLPVPAPRWPGVLSLLSLITCLWMTYTLYEQQSLIRTLTRQLESRETVNLSRKDTVVVVREIIRERTLPPVWAASRQAGGEPLPVGTPGDLLPGSVVPRQPAVSSGVAEQVSFSGNERTAAGADDTPADATGKKTADTLAPKAAPRREPVPTETQTGGKTRFRLAALQPSLGLDFQVSGGSVAVGPVVSLLTAGRMGLSFGVQVERFFADHYRDAAGFNAATGQDFLRDYQNRLPDRYDRLEDLSLRTTMINLPVQLNYLIPVSGRWAVLAQTGTRLNIANFRQVGFETHQGGEETYHFFETQVPVSVFRNLRFGAGMQYRKGRVTIQAVPFFEYLFRSIPGIRKSEPFGLRTSVGIDLFPGKVFR